MGICIKKKGVILEECTSSTWVVHSYLTIIMSFHKKWAWNLMPIKSVKKASSRHSLECTAKIMTGLRAITHYTFFACS
jgi:hypothetical protein